MNSEIYTKFVLTVIAVSLAASDVTNFRRHDSEFLTDRTEAI